MAEHPKLYDEFYKRVEDFFGEPLSDRVKHVYAASLEMADEEAETRGWALGVQYQGDKTLLCLMDSSTGEHIPGSEHVSMTKHPDGRDQMRVRMEHAYLSLLYITKDVSKQWAVFSGPDAKEPEFYVTRLASDPESIVFTSDVNRLIKELKGGKR